MSKRIVVSYADTPRYKRGLVRLSDAVNRGGDVIVPWGHPPTTPSKAGTWEIPRSWPSHAETPYAFKAYALKEAFELGYTTLLWADACMLPIAKLAPLWERIERDGYWFSRCGYTNYEWTADSAYPDLFHDYLTHHKQQYTEETALPPEYIADIGMARARRTNRTIEHVVATSFGISLEHTIGRAFLEEYYRLASETTAFCGPWTNLANLPNDDVGHDIRRLSRCGPADVRGHRHDQTAASVIAWRLGMKLTSAPDIFAYGRPGDSQDPRTILLADGSYA